MNILSICDGMSCAQIALKELNIPIEVYYASEIDKHAIKQTQLNFPNTIQLGDMEKWREWDINWSTIDIIFAGTPCQGFSNAGKGLAFNDPRSKLFFVFVDILNHCKKHNPNVKFLLENVSMKKSWLGIISEHVGVYPISINAALVSAQNRERYFWCNFKTKEDGLFGSLVVDIEQPKDSGIFLKDILEKDVDKKYYYTQKALDWFKRTSEKTGTEMYIFKETDKFPCIVSSISKLYSNQSFFGIKDTFGLRFVTPTECSRLQSIPDWYIWNCSKTKQYTMLGNGWNIEVIKHILNYL